MNMTQHAQKIKMGRRRLLAALPAIGAFGATGAIAAVSTETPVENLFRQWRTQHQLSLASETDDERDAIDEVRSEIELRLFALPAQNERDICLKLLALTLNGIEWMDDGYNNGSKIARETRALIGEAA